MRPRMTSGARLARAAALLPLTPPPAVAQHRPQQPRATRSQQTLPYRSWETALGLTSLSETQALGTMQRPTSAAPVGSVLHASNLELLLSGSTSTVVPYGPTLASSTQGHRGSVLLAPLARVIVRHEHSLYLNLTAECAVTANILQLKTSTTSRARACPPATE